MANAVFGKSTHTSPITPASRRNNHYHHGLTIGLILGALLILALWGASELLR